MTKWKLIGILMAFTTMVWGVPSFADGGRIKFVTSYLGGTRAGALSPNQRYVAVHRFLSRSVAYRVLKFSPRARKYTRGPLIRVKSTEICGVTNRGALVLHNFDTNTRDFYDAHGKKNRSESASRCGPHFRENPWVLSDALSESRKAELRQLLCTVPANEAFTAEGETRTLTDIFAIKASMPNGQVLAVVNDMPINYENTVYSRYGGSPSMVLIDPAGYAENYCVRSQLSVSDEDPACQFEASGPYDDSTPFFARYTLPIADPLNCRFTITQVNSTGHESSTAHYVVEWQEGEYNPIQVTGQFSTPIEGDVPRMTNFDVAVEGCGHVIEPTSDNPKLRMTSFGIGNLYCSHV
jgi:hypothetical protein